MATTIKEQHAVPRKRQSSTNGDGNALKLRRHYNHDHKIKSKQIAVGHQTPVSPGFASNWEQLSRAVLLILEAVGFDSVEPQALQSVVGLVEEYMAHFLASARRSMLSARRTQPVPHDFVAALSENQLTLRSLLPHLDPPVKSSSLQPSLAIEDSNGDDSIQQAQLVDRLLAENSKSHSYVPRTFPALPSRHTFKSDAAYRQTPLDVKQIREQATVEGRLGEEALRRLMSKKASDDDSLLSATSSSNRKAVRQQSRALWKETFERALQASKPKDDQPMLLDPLAGPDDPENKVTPHVGPAVNADSVYWRKPVTRRKLNDTAGSEG